MSAPGNDEGRQVPDQIFHSLDHVAEEFKIEFPSISSEILQDSNATRGLKQELVLSDSDECTSLIGARLQGNCQSGSSHRVADKETLTITLDREVFNSWCGIGSDFCADSHSQIAEFLVHSYWNKVYLEPSKSCGICGTLLSWQCVHCLAKQPQQITELGRKAPKLQKQAQRKSVEKVKPKPQQKLNTKKLGNLRLRQHQKPCESLNDVQTLASALMPKEGVPSSEIRTLNDVGDEDENDNDVTLDAGRDIVSENNINKKKPDKDRGGAKKKMGSLRRQKRDVDQKEDGDKPDKDRGGAKKKMGSLRRQKRDVDQKEDGDDFVCGDKSSYDSDSDETSGVAKKKTGRPSLKSSRGKYDCNDCGKSYCTFKGLRHHRQQHSGDLPYCHICGKTFTTLNTLKVHQNTIHAGLKPFVCDVCNRSFGQSSNLRMHKLTHSDARPHVCGLCGKGFKILKQLKNHTVTHTGSKDHVCEVCGKCFNLDCNLRRHRRIHAGIKRFTCGICNKAFSQAANLAKHKLQHSPPPGQPKVNVKSYVKQVRCDTCGKSFSSGYIKIHKMTHTGEKPHVCGVCNKGFNQSFYLKAHKLMHMGQKPYVCKVCNRSFTFSSSLSAHKLIHVSQKSFVCEVCSKVIKNNSNFRRHMLSHAK